MDPAARAELADLYRRVDARVAASRPRCELSGRCCDFPTSGHELWTTALEVEYARAAWEGAVPPAAGSGLCPFHVDGLCTHREGRPLGCRVYFCDPAWAAEMPAVYEAFHGELAALHVRHQRPYGYRRFVDVVGDPARRPPTDPATPRTP